MALQLKVSNIAFEGCAEIITESIYVMESEVKVDVDLNAKTVTVESEASEESIKQIIVAAGYAVEGYRSDSSFSQKKFRL
ncbi:MAG: heavy-metal-associated domain-containing protein [Nostoc sp.]|uniref:heavy-metal-associated domain-containing protein n=1 Tax=Nostoc sp. TaxID=1180 RepID=UPI002FF80F4D